MALWACTKSCNTSINIFKALQMRKIFKNPSLAATFRNQIDSESKVAQMNFIQDKSVSIFLAGTDYFVACRLNLGLDVSGECTFRIDDGYIDNVYLRTTFQHNFPNPPQDVQQHVKYRTAPFPPNVNPYPIILAVLVFLISVSIPLPHSAIAFELLWFS